MNLYELKYFTVLAEYLHFGKASRACHLSPSALTRAVQRLEEAVGQPLLIRDNRNVMLTPAGRTFLDYARRAVQDWQTLQETLQEEDVVSGPLSIYASITAVYSLLPGLLDTCRAAHPGIQIELHTGAAEQAVDQVLTGQIDLAVAALPDRTEGALRFLPLTKIPLVFIAPRKGSLAAPPRRRGGALDLMRTPLVLPQQGLSRLRLDRWIKQQKIQPDIRAEVSGSEALIALVRLGCGIGLVPQLVLEKSPFRNEVQVLSRTPALAPYTVGLCAAARSLRRPAVQAFWELTEQRASAEKV